MYENEDYNLDDIKRTARETPNMLLDKDSIRVKMNEEGARKNIEWLPHLNGEK